MRRSILILSVLAAIALLLGCNEEKTQQDRFTETERELRIRAEQELVEQRNAAEGWQGAAAVLALGCIVCLLVGVAAGSKAKHSAGKDHGHHR